MRNVWIMLLTLTISTFFIHVPHSGSVGFIFNDKVVLSYNQYVWWICQHLQIVVLVAVMWDESRRWHLRSEEKRAMLTRIYKGYLLVVIADVLMHVLSYDDPLKRYRITWNIIKTVIFIGVIAYEKWLNNKGRISNQG